MFELTPRALEGLRAYYREAAALRLARTAGRARVLRAPVIAAERL